MHLRAVKNADVQVPPANHSRSPPLRRNPKHCKLSNTAAHCSRTPCPTTVARVVARACLTDPAARTEVASQLKTLCRSFRTSTRFHRP